MKLYLDQGSLLRFVFHSFIHRTLLNIFGWFMSFLVSHKIMKHIDMKRRFFLLTFADVPYILENHVPLPLAFAHEGMIEGHA